MPHAIASSNGVDIIEHYDGAVRKLLARARQIKPHGGIDPALKAVDLEEGLKAFELMNESETHILRDTKSAAVETALRRVFYEILATTSIEDPSFIDMWSLLDITTILSDDEACETQLPFWLVEELLESQTLDNCRKIFDYLESRREAMVAKHYRKKSLPLLRACNDLLKRLSRAEDTVFCGRVFIYLFSSLAFGDRSSVNLRGEFHVANTTSFDQPPYSHGAKTEAMDIDQKAEDSVQEDPTADAIITVTEPVQEAGSKGEQTDLEKSKVNPNSEAGEQAPDYDTIYPIFWTLQDFFSKPSSLFEGESLATFRHGLQVTLAKFKEIQQHTDSASNAAGGDDSKVPAKRKWQDEESSKAAFNPKYLTSRDLFELEISDLAFRRHFLVQSLILLDFLLYQTPKSKRKLESLKNKSVIYTYTLDEEQATWAEKMRNEIAAHLQKGPEGKFYYRMVDTVLSRDKNWVHWKAESCPSFSRTPISPAQYAEAQNGAKRASTVKRPKNNPLGALDLNFLAESATTNGLDKLKEPERYKVPEMDSYRKQILNDELDLDFASTDQEKARLMEGRASKTWRTLRIASRSKFSIFDKLEDGKQLDVLFKDPDEEGHDEKMDTEEHAEKDPEVVDEKVQQVESTDGTIEMQIENTEAPSEPKPHNPDQIASIEPIEEHDRDAGTKADDMASEPSSTMMVEEPAVT